MLPFPKMTVSVQDVDFHQEVCVLLHNDTHYAQFTENGVMMMVPFEEGVRAVPTMRVRPEAWVAIRAAFVELVAPNLEERSREQGQLEGKLEAMAATLSIEAQRVNKMIDKLLGDVT